MDPYVVFRLGIHSGHQHQTHERQYRAHDVRELPAITEASPVVRLSRPIPFATRGIE